MTTDPRTTAWLDQEHAHLAQVIRAHRFAVQYVGPGDAPGEPPFGYTVGLFGVGHPELVVVGLGHDVAHGVLDVVGRFVVGGGNLVPGELVHDDTGFVAPAVEVLPDPGEVLFSANLSTSGLRSSRCRRSSSPGPTPTVPSRGTRGTPVRPRCSRGRGRGGRDAQPRPSSRRSLATWPVALTL